MARSLHTQQLAARAARRIARPWSRRRDEGLLLRGWADGAARGSGARIVVRTAKPPPGTLHALTARDVRRFLETLGPEARYGLRAVRLLRECRFTRAGMVFGEYVMPGEIRLYAVPAPPWALEFVPDEAELAAFARHGARVEADDGADRTTLHWSREALRDYCLFEVLAHELGHHLLQHHGGKRPAPRFRRRDHERRAELQSARVWRRMRTGSGTE